MNSISQNKLRADGRAGYRISCAYQVPAEWASNPVHPVILSLPSFPCPFDALFIHHGNDFTPVHKNQKTYRRLFSMIFFGGSEALLIPYLQRLAMRKISKNRQKPKTNSIFIS